ncbi:MAG: oligosaccharide flippase family protein [Desulfovibrionaceae bacterium]|nr:oligosaccharide flippase family protein [Desulfovibrionaceae bacterium]
MHLKDIPKRLGYILGAQWTRDLSWTIFTILLARYSQAGLGQIVLALTYGYLIKTIVDVGLNDYLSSSFARGEVHPRILLGQVTWLKLAVYAPALLGLWFFIANQGYTLELRLIVMSIAAGLGLDAIVDSFLVLCQARGRQDVEMRIRIPSSLIGIGLGITCVLLKTSPLIISLYKPLESLLSLAFVILALKHNPLQGLGLKHLKDLLLKMRSGLIFTGMAICAMFYNKVNVIFLKQYGGDAEVGGYGVAWETLEGVSTLVSGALLGKVIFPLLTKFYAEDFIKFKQLASQTAKSLWGAALPLIFLVLVESDRFLTLVYGSNFAEAATAQRLLTPCLATAFLHNLAAYAMIGMKLHVLLFGFYFSGVVVNLILCALLIPQMPLEGAALSLSLTKVWVAILTVGFFQMKAKPLSLKDWFYLLLSSGLSLLIFYFFKDLVWREVAEILGILPLLALFWAWRPPAPFTK